MKLFISIIIALLIVMFFAWRKYDLVSDQYEPWHDQTVSKQLYEPDDESLGGEAPQDIRNGSRRIRVQTRP